jgi:hypothetical protein
MKIFSLVLLSVLLLSSCHERSEEKKLLPELYGHWLPADLNGVSGSDTRNERPPPIAGSVEQGFSFDSNGIADVKRGYYRVLRGEERRDRKLIYLGSKTKYYVKGDSLKIFNLTDSTWWSLKIAKLTEDTLSFATERGEPWTFVRKNYSSNAEPAFDKIVVSTSGCYGTCQVSNTIISSDGQVTFYGERYTTKTGFYNGSVPVKLYQELESNFRKADIVNLPKEFSGGFTDGEKITVTFIKGDSIYKTVSDYGNAGPNELVWAFIPFRYLYQNVHLKPLHKARLPFYPALHSLKFEKNDKELVLPQSESFLLWDYLRKGKKTNNSFKERFTLSFEQNYTWFPSWDEEMRGKGYDSSEAERVKEISTDGRYFKFLVEGEDPVTIDTGFNFFDRNYSEEEFKMKGEY